MYSVYFDFRNTVELEILRPGLLSWILWRSWQGVEEVKVFLTYRVSSGSGCASDVHQTVMLNQIKSKVWSGDVA